jgi:hypothetical protein
MIELVSRNAVTLGVHLFSSLARSLSLTQAKAAEATRREDALRSAAASGEAAAKVTLTPKTPREQERDAMVAWLKQSGFSQLKRHAASRMSAQAT